MLKSAESFIVTLKLEIAFETFIEIYIPESKLTGNSPRHERITYTRIIRKFEFTRGFQNCIETPRDAKLTFTLREIKT